MVNETGQAGTQQVATPEPSATPERRKQIDLAEALAVAARCFELREPQDNMNGRIPGAYPMEDLADYLAMADDLYVRSLQRQEGERGQGNTGGVTVLKAPSQAATPSEAQAMLMDLARAFPSVVTIADRTTFRGQRVRYVSFDVERGLEKGKIATDIQSRFRDAYQGLSPTRTPGSSQPDLHPNFSTKVHYAMINYYQNSPRR